MALLQEIKVPLLSVNDTVLTVVELGFENGGIVKKGDVVMVFETSKTTFSVEAEAEGFVQYHCEAGKDYEVNHRVAAIYSDVAELVLPAMDTSVKKLAGDLVFSNGNGRQWQGETLFSDAAKALIASKNVDIAAFKGLDFVTSADVEDLLGIRTNAPAPGITTNCIQPSKTVQTTPAREDVILQKLTAAKRKEISFLSEIQSTGLTSTINTSIITEGLIASIDKGLKYLKGSLLPVVIYETARLLKKYPLLNAYYTGSEIAVYKEVNIGFAIDIDKGLKVLKVPHQSTVTISQIEQTIMDLSGTYLDDAIRISDLTDITFTITDLSAYAVSSFRPLINMQNSAILGIAAIDPRSQRCEFSVTFDHRVTEGKVVAMFLQDLKERLESYRITSDSSDISHIECYKCFKSLKDELSDIGFAKVITPQGKEGYICQSCLKGF